jgi:hypothetical protein
MHTRILILAIPCLFLHAVLMGQTEDFGLWTTIGAGQKTGKWDFGTEAELRTKNNSGQVDRYSLKLSADYKLLKPLEAGIGYQFIYFHNTKYMDFQPRHRIYFFLQVKPRKLGDFSVSLRERIQLTTKDEIDRLKKSGGKDTYKINPAISWRSRLKVAYNIPRFPVNPSLSFESFYQLNNPEGNDFYKLRYTLSFSYNMKKHHEFDVYGLLDQEINFNEPVRKYVLGIAYVYSF